MKKLLILCCLFLTQTLHATTFGPLANFDVVNDTGKVAHGFEIDIHDIHASNITSIFGDANRWPGMERYGVPVVTEYTDNIRLGYGVRIRYEDSTKSTPSGTLPVSPSDSCWPYGAPTYGPNYPCDHFGVSTNVNTPSVKYSWLVETSPGASTVVLEQANVPNPNWVVVVPAPINNVPQPPVVNVIVRAPEPLPRPELPEPQFGEPQWVKVTATGLGYPVAVEDLVAENKVIKEAEKNVQVEWQLIQTDPGNPAAGQIDLSGVKPDPGFQSIVYRFEYYKYIGPRNDTGINADNQALPVADTYGAPNSPPADELGDFVVANNAAINLNGDVLPAPPLPVPISQDPPTISTTLVDGTVGIAYTANINVTPANVGDTIVTDVTGLPTGLTFNGTDTVTGIPNAAGVFNVIINSTDTTTNKPASLLVVVSIGAGAVPVACSGINETIFNLGRAGWFETATHKVIYPDQAHTTMAPGMVTWTNGDVVQYIGVMDQSNVFCVASTMTVSHVLTVPAMTFAKGQAGFKYSSVVITPTGGFAPFAINVTGLPAGMVFDGIDTISGTPTVAGTFTFTIDVSDFTKQYVLSSNSITIDAAPVVNVSATLSNGTVGTQYPVTNVSTSGGIGNIALTQSGLPSGLQLIGNTISGTPSASGTFNVTLTGTDSYGTIGTAKFSITINNPPANFTAAVSSTSLTVKRGSSVNDMVTIGALYGFNSSVGLTISGLPKNAKATFTPSSIIGAGSSTLKVTAASTTPRGTYTLTITAQSGALSHTMIVSLTVQ